jgi:hypothetical protein
MQTIASFIVTAAVGALATPVAAEPAKWLQAGTLTCTMGPSIGLVRSGRQQARCVFESAAAKPTDRYTGKMEREGQDVGIPSGGRFFWAVMTQGPSLPAKALVGRYTGGTGQVAFEGDDFAEAALCSKRKSPVCLRPLAREMQVRENLAFGTSALKLE